MSYVRERRLDFAGAFMDNIGLILSGLLFSSVGLGYFIYGRRQNRKLALLAGIALMVSPYFVPSTLAMVVTGGLLMSLPWFLDL